MLAELGISLPLDRPARRLSVAEQQLTEIAKALVRHARLIVMDEPTAALTDRETDALFALIAKLKAQGVAFVYISHRLEELPRIADRITVIRDGKAIETRGRERDAAGRCDPLDGRPRARSALSRSAGGRRRCAGAFGRARSARRRERQRRLVRGARG